MVTVLVAKDDREDREALATYLRRFGHTVECSPDGAQAIRTLDRLNPDLVILDISMPVMGGIEFLDAVRADANWRDLPVIVVSGQSSPSMVERTRARGVRQYFVKGTEYFGDLLEAVNRIERKREPEPQDRGTGQT